MMLFLAIYSAVALIPNLLFANYYRVRGRRRLAAIFIAGAIGCAVNIIAWAFGVEFTLFGGAA